MKIDSTKPPDDIRKEPVQTTSAPDKSQLKASTVSQGANSASLAVAGKTKVQISRNFGEANPLQEQQIINEAFCALSPDEAIFVEITDDGKFFLANDKICQGKKMEGVILEHKLDAQRTDILVITNYSSCPIKVAGAIPISPNNSFETSWYVADSSSTIDSYPIQWGQGIEHCFNVPFILSKVPLPPSTLIFIRQKHIQSDDPRSLKIEDPDLNNAQVLALVKEYGTIAGTYRKIYPAYEGDPAALNSIQHECITPAFPGECESIRINNKRIFKIYNGKPPVYDRGFDAPVFESGFIIYKGFTFGYLIQPEVDMTVNMQELSDFEDYINSLGYEFIDPSLGQVGFYNNPLTANREIVLIDPRSVRQSANPIKRVFI